jgi:hypothetical protein
MSTSNPANRPASQLNDAGAQPGARRPYHKPAFRHERVFETRALVCGKVETTQQNCADNRKFS